MGHTRPSLREHALSDQQWRVLRVLGEHGAVEVGRVAREAFILGPSLTGVLARMERDELITRSRDPDDQRRTMVEATAQGMKLVKRFDHEQPYTSRQVGFKDTKLRVATFTIEGMPVGRTSYVRLATMSGFRAFRDEFFTSIGFTI